MKREELGFGFHRGKGMRHGWGSRGGRREREEEIGGRRKNCSV